ncbi:MAG: glutamate--cysteine ligase [Nitrospirales bacterium]
MGLQITREHFDDDHYRQFGERLTHSLAALNELLHRPGFGEGAQSIGAEMELSIIDEKGQALPINRAVLNQCVNEQLQLELDRFNLEYNLVPVALAGNPFFNLQKQLEKALALLERSANCLGGRIVPIGILPTLRINELDSSVMSDLPRYRALSAGLRRLKRGPFIIHIDGAEPLSVTCQDVTLEGAATSFQVHLRVDPNTFANVYNAAQLATSVVLALSVNSPTFLGQRLWDETRVALFKQAIDSRKTDEHDWQPPARVSFGFGWVRKGAYELFAEAVGLFPPLLPVVGNEDPWDCLAKGYLPKLEELRLHQGTVWRWNRAIYDANDHGHIRIELRALPSGPTPIDMVASAAFLIGLTLGLSRKIETLLPHFPFDYAHRNFYRAAQYGVDATLLWPTSGVGGPKEMSVCALAEELLPIAQEGLCEAGVNQQEIDRLFQVIRRRIQTRMTGARWQLMILEQLDKKMDRSAALSEMLERYLTHSHTGVPVAEWSREVS